MQFVPLPRMNPLQPSSFHIFPRADPTDSLYASRPTLCTCSRIFSRSRGDTTVLETAPATPPPQNAATTGCDIHSRKSANDSVSAGCGGPATAAGPVGDCIWTFVVLADDDDGNRDPPLTSDMAVEMSCWTSTGPLGGSEPRGKDRCFLPGPGWKLFAEKPPIGYHDPFPKSLGWSLGDPCQSGI